MCLAPLLLLLAARDLASFTEQSVGGLHGHTAEVGDEVRAIGVAGDVALSAPPRVLATEREHVPAMAAPVRSDVVDRLESVGNAVVDLLRVVLLYNTRVYAISHLSPSKAQGHLRLYLISIYTS